MPRFFGSLRARLMLLVFITFVPALGFMFQMVWERYTSETLRVKKETHRLINLVSMDHRQLIEQSRFLLRVVANLPGIKSCDVEASRKILTDIHVQHPIYANMALVAPTGELLCSTLQTDQPINYADREWLAQVNRTKAFTISEFIFGRQSRRPVVVFAYPILHATGDLRAILFASLDLGWVNHSAIRRHLPEGTDLTMIDKHGTILVRAPDYESWVGKNPSEAPLIQSMLAEQYGFSEMDGIDGVKRLYAFAPLGEGPEGNVFISVGIPSALAYREAHQALANAIWMVLVMATALAAAWLLGKLTIMRHVDGLLNASERVGGGDLGVRTGPPYLPGELGQLSEAFDRMAESLERREAERQRFHEELRGSEEHFRLTFDQSPVGAAILSFGGRYLRVNQAFCNLVGYTQEELLELTFADVTHPDDLQRIEDAVHYLVSVKTGYYRSEKRYIKKTGETVHALRSVGLMSDEDGNPLNLLSIIEDITDRKKAEETLCKTNRVLRLKSDCNKAVVRAENEADLLQSACDLLVNVGGYRLAWVGFAEHDEEKTITPAAYAGFDDGYLESVSLRWGEGDLGSGPSGKAIRSGQPHISEDVRLDPDYVPWREELLKRGYLSSAAFPLVSSGRAFGVLHLYSDRVNILIPDELRLIRDLAEDLAYGITALRTQTQRDHAYHSIRKRESYFRSLLSNMQEDILVIDLDYTIRDASKEILPTLNRRRDRLIGKKCHEVLFCCPQPCVFNGKPCCFEEVVATGKPSTMRIELEHPDGVRIWVDALWSPLRDESGAIVQVINTIRNVTEEVRTESHLRRAQKMEAIGTLAGGIAHDFNNVLGVIMGYTEMTAMRLEKGSKEGANLQHVMDACLRAREVVKQILTFSRMGDQELKPLHLGLIVREALQFMEAALPSTIDIQSRLEVDSTFGDLVIADPAQIHQVIMNLCTNAAHAMREKGGSLVAVISGTVIDPMFGQTVPDLAPGRYVRLSVSDTGHGMDAAIMERIFEPYFTSKAYGEGTGLGLSLVHGIVKKHGGAITVYSQPGVGTSFHVYLPKSETGHTSEPPKPAPSAGGNETILYVDDDPRLAEIGKEMLHHLGYTVIQKPTSLEALEVFRAAPFQFDMVITDQTMPGITGLDLAREIANIRGDIPVILCSGYSEVVTPEKLKSAGIREFLMKPLSFSNVAETIRRVLDETRKQNS